MEPELYLEGNYSIRIAMSSAHKKIRRKIDEVSAGGVGRTGYMNKPHK